MKRRKLASLKIWNQPFYISAVLSFLDSLVSNHRGMEYGRYSKMRYVVGGLLESRIKNAYPNANGPIEVEVYLADAFFEVSIKDQGVPQWEDFTYHKKNIADDRKSMRNYILDKWTDEIGMEKLGKDGQRIFVRMRIHNPIDFKAPEPYPEMEVLDTNISIRRVETEEDIIEAIRCIYSAYGYTYGYERLYYMESFKELIQNREIMSFLAVNDHGQVAGHFALAFSDTFRNMPEISTVVIRKEFRSLGLFSVFMDHCVKVAKEEGCRALMGQPVTYHPMSQKAALRAGFTATSLLMDYISSDSSSEFNDGTDRLDLTVGIRIMDETAKSSVYPPKELISFIKKIYTRLGWEYEFLENVSVGENTQICIEDNIALKMKKLLVRSGDQDLKQILESSIQDALRKKHEMIELLILLNDSSCEYSYQIAKECGFAFSGVIPGGEAGDYLVMQMLVGSDMNYDDLMLVGEYEELKQDIIILNGKG